MTREDYEMIAKVLRPKVLAGCYECFVIAHDLGNEFAVQNERFARDKFLRASGCYGEDNQ